MNDPEPPAEEDEEDATKRKRMTMVKRMSGISGSPTGKFSNQVTI